jgi:hypothetical protein
MGTYKIEVQEFLSRVISIEANTVEEAIAIISDDYKKAHLVLNSNDFVDVNFIDIDAKELKSKKDELTLDIIDYLIEDEKKHFEEFDKAPKDHIYLKLKKLKDLIKSR